MKTKIILILLTCLLFIFWPGNLSGQSNNPEDIKEWKGKTIMFFGAHPDDETSVAGTLSILAANGNNIYVVIYTSGNKGSRDLEMTSERLAQIRRKENIAADREIGIPEENIFFLGYDDGMLEYVPQKELCEKVCWFIRKYRPDAVFSFDPGEKWMQWHKTDHRMSAFISLDGARAAAYHLYFPHHRIDQGLQPFTVRDFFFFDTREPNYKVDITAVSEKKIRARSWHVSQFGDGNFKYTGPEPDQQRLKEQLKNNADRIAKGEKIYENLRRVQESLSF
jgi:LmbE family N-acetylglucosaminyl deacetylase